MSVLPSLIIEYKLSLIEAIPRLVPMKGKPS